MDGEAAQPIEPETNGYMLVDAEGKPVLEIGLFPTTTNGEMRLNLRLMQAQYKIVPAQVNELDTLPESPR